MMKTAAKPFSMEVKEVSRPGLDVGSIIAESGAHVKRNFEERASRGIHHCPNCDQKTFGTNLPGGGHVDVCPDCCKKQNFTQASAFGF